MSGTPGFFSPAQVYYAGTSGAATPMSIPWVTSFDQLLHREQVCILNNDLNPTVPAGLYVQMPVVGPNNSVTMRWKLGLAIADVNYLSSNTRQFNVAINQSTTQAYDNTYLVWKNGVVESDYTLTASSTAIWVWALASGSGQQGGGGVSTFAALTDSPLANTLLAAQLAGKASLFQQYDAVANVPAISSGTLPSTGTNALVVTNQGVTTLGTPIDGITAVRYNDGLVLNASLGTWQRVPGPVDLPIVVSTAITLSDVYDDTTITFPTTQTVTINTGLVADFGCTFVGPFTVAGSETTIQAGNFVVGGTYTIVSVGTTSFTSIGASANTVGVVFTATGVGTGNGTANGIIDQRVQDGSNPVVATLVRTTSNTYVLKGSK